MYGYTAHLAAMEALTLQSQIRDIDAKRTARGLAYVRSVTEPITRMLAYYHSGAFRGAEMAELFRQRYVLRNNPQDIYERLSLSKTRLYVLIRRLISHADKYLREYGQGGVNVGTEQQGNSEEGSGAAIRQGRCAYQSRRAAENA